MFKKLSLITTTIAALSSSACFADLAVITHPSASISASKAEVSALFLGKSKSLGGQKLTPVDQEEGSPSRDQFYQLLSNKNPSQLNAYWARIVFTGKGQPPKALMDDSEVKEFVASNADSIAYIDSSEVDDSVKVIMTVK
ncbi:phosphate ABC transporter substrate-binding protein [uncultured Pseudoteredinibacter sp.]|uniref:phosphate ABC transporter substrate-binding protein n=1 Tax=uncultured Pseudoteredinibacter sp. TaxID=1641701 RepID=UPI0026249888|nr:phosphate ABC transporter substrate-binding protein [uncultured Pseudoteredinibacter sp.]